MIIPTTHSCDSAGCTQRHETTNGWYCVTTDDEGTRHVYEYAIAVRRGLVDYGKHYCGIAHLMQSLSAGLGASQTQGED